MQVLNIYPSRSNCYVQFDNRATVIENSNSNIPPEIQEIFNLNLGSMSPSISPNEHINTMDITSFTLEPESVFDDNDFEIMFGNQNERFVGSFQDFDVYSMQAIDFGCGSFH